MTPFLHDIPWLKPMSAEFAFWFSLTSTLRQLGGVGLLLLGIIDSSVVPTFGSLDALVAVLSARHPDLWLYYAMMSVVGSLLGAYTTYRIGRRIGIHGLERKLKPARLSAVSGLFQRWGFRAVALPALAPPPFPTSLLFLGAGAFNYSLRKYLLVVGLARTLRYCAIGYLGARFGRNMVQYFRHPERHVSLYVFVFLTAAVLIIGSSMLWNYLSKPQTNVENV
jgi:membrane protein YqaA with SNARE-associated domain